MDFALSDDQESLGAAARSLLDGFASPTQVRGHMASGDAYDAALWMAMVSQGWVGIAVPEKHGGIGLGWVEAAVLLGEVGRHTAPAPLLPTLVALAALVDSSDAGGPGGDHIEAVAAGERLAAVGWSRDPHAVRAQQSAGGSWTLTGRTDPAEALSAADLVVVPAGDELFLVDCSAAGRPSAEPAMDGTRALARLELDATPVERVGGTEAVCRLLDRGALGASAEMLGGSERVLEMATQYAKDRVQFGQPIGSFQAVKHRCADMLVDVEGMRSVVWHGAWSLSAGDASIAASTAKVWCADAAKRTMSSGLQVHGGIGFTWEHDLHLYLKRSQFDQLHFGDAAFHRTRLAGLLRAEVRAGRSVI